MRLGLKQKLWLPLILCLMALVAVFAFVNYQLYQAQMEERKSSLQHIVNIAVNITQDYQQLVSKGVLSKEEAQKQALQRIGTYLGQNPSFDSEQAAVTYLASISTGFGPHTPEQWRALSLPLLREREGRWWLHYDPAISVPFKAMTATADAAAARQIVRAGEAALWGLFDAIRSPTLLLRGAQSDLLTPETATLMTQRGPHARLVTFDGVGHAPTLVADDQVAAVRDFLWAS